MSGLEVVGLVLAVIPVIARGLTSAVKLNLFRPAREYRRRRFGLWSRILYYFFLFDTDSVQELHRNINYWGSEDLKAWKDSYIASCNAIAVAVTACSA